MMLDRAPSPASDHITNRPTVGKQYRADIDGLRALAVLAVLAFHAFPAHMPGGFVGVDIFFVISGFLISRLLLQNLRDRNSLRLGEFFVRRIKRIFPSLVVVLTACLLFGWFNLLPSEYAQLGKHAIAGAGFVANFAFWLETGYFDNAAITKPLLHLWSLGIEEQFYIIWPPLLYALWRSKLSLAAATAVIAGLSFLVNLFVVYRDPVAAFYLPITRFWELLLGAVLALRWHHFGRSHDPKSGEAPNPLDIASKRDALFNNVQSVLGALLIVAAFVLTDRSAPFPGWVALLPTVGTYLSISAGPNSYLNRIVLSNRALVWIGLISYPLYLWHYPVLSFAHILENGRPTAALSLTLLALSFILAWLTYRLVEIPIRFGKSSKLRLATVVGCLACLATAGLNVYNREGLPSRAIVKVNAAVPGAVPADEVVWERRSHCRREFPFDEIHYCLKDSLDATDVLLIGDSHAEAIYWGLSEYYRSTGRTLTVVGMGGCLGFQKTDNAPVGQKTPCPELSDRILKYAQNSPSIKTVIHAARGPLYITGAGFVQDDDTIDDRGLIIHLKYDDQIASFAQAYRRGMNETLRLLRSTGKEIIFVVDVPELGFDIKRCYGRRSSFGMHAHRTPCAVSRSKFEQRNEQYWQVTESVLRHIPGVKAFKPSKYLCDEQWCWAIKDDIAMYRDDDHLSLVGSQYIGRRFAAWLGESRNP